MYVVTAKRLYFFTCPRSVEPRYCQGHSPQHPGSQRRRRYRTCLLSVDTLETKQQNMVSCSFILSHSYN